MKKKYLFGILFSLVACAGVTTACNSPSNVNVAFEEDEYTLSVGESVDFSNEIKIEGAAKEEIVLTSSNKQIIDLEEGIFKAKSSGQTYILAKYQDILVGQVKVKVRYKFSSPSNFTISESGVLSWDKSSATVEGRVVNAQRYSLSYGLVVDGQETVYDKVETSTNQYLLTKGNGVYSIKVQALAHNSEFDSSEVVEDEINYGAMGRLENVSLTNSRTGGVATLNWKAKENALYDVYIEGFKVASNLDVNSFTYDYDIFPTAEKVSLEIIAKPNGNIQALESATQITLTKPRVPTIVYANGKIVVSECDNAAGYILKDMENIEIDLGMERESNLEGLEEGIYYVRAMAKGSKGDGLVLNSGFSQEIMVGKLPKPQFNITMDGNLVRASFGSRAANEDYRFFYGIVEEKYAANRPEADPVDLSAAIMSPGAYTFNVQGVPSANSMIEQDQISTANVLSSDIASYTVYKLGQIENIKHSIDGTTSQIEFDKLENATNYRLYINDSQSAIETFVEEEGKIKFTIPDLNTIAPVNGKYTFRVEAFKLDEGGKLISTTSTQTKEVSILGLTGKAQSQTNGFFSWNVVEGAKYEYAIYKANKQGVIVDGIPVQRSETEQTQSATALAVGYYKIKIYSKTANEDLFLDATFADSNNYFEDHFAVTDQIDAPSVEFVEDGDVYKLKIGLTEFAGEYQIKVNGVLDGVCPLGEDLYSQGQREIYYQLNNDFAQSKDYTISVVATAGLLHDPGINLDSQPTTILVTRVAQAQYSVSIQKDGFGRISGQILNSQKVENVVDMKATRGDSEVGLVYNLATNSYSLDMNDLAEYGSNFTISLTNIAREQEGDHYYLDSIEATYSFARVDSPTNVEYSAGVLSFDNADQNAEKYLVCLTTVETLAGGANPVYNYFYLAFETTSKSFNLQNKIANLIRENSAFATSYNQMDYIKVAVRAIANNENGGVHYLPSAESDEKSIEDLTAVSLSFDRATQTLSWEGGVEGGKYDLYINRTSTSQPAMKDLTNTSITLAEINGLDLSSIQTITVVSKHNKYFDSKESNAIKIKQLDYARGVAISKENGQYKGVINITTDSASVSKVLVDGEETLLATGAANAQFDITTEGDKTVQLFAKTEMIDGVYYLDSQVKTFKLVKLGAITASINRGNIVWNNPAEGVMARANAQPYQFELTFKDGSTVATYTTTNTQIQINQIESLFNVDLGDTTEDFTIEVKVVFSNSYVLTIEDDDAIGLFGESQTEDAVVSHKLHSISDASVVVTDSASTDEVAKKMNSTTDITFTNYWEDFTAVRFSIAIDEDNVIPIAATNSYVPGIYKLSLAEGKWTLSLNSNLFKNKLTTVSVSVAGEGNITSDEQTITINRFGKVKGLTLSEEGILTITDDQQDANYAVSLYFGQTVKTKTFTAQEISAIDMTSEDWLGDLGYGDYTISVIAYDANAKVLPSTETNNYNSHQYEGIKQAYINEEGKIVLAVAADSFTNSIFTVKTNLDEGDLETSFVPTLEKIDGSGDASVYIYTITIPDAVALFKKDMTQSEYRDYSMYFTVRAEDGINSAWRVVDFSYNQGAQENLSQTKRADYDEDYIIVPVIENITTHSIRVKVTAADGSESIRYYTTMQEGYTLSSIAGCWIEGTNGGRFSVASDVLAGESATECYAIPLNEVLADIEYGDYEVEVFRTAIDGSGNYIQYKPVSFNGYKLCTIYDGATTSTLQSLEIKGGYSLEWQWKQDDTVSANAKPANAYYVVFSDGEHEIKFFTELPVYDLRTCGLQAGVQYSITVVALSFDSQVLASNHSSEREAMQYVKPMTPMVVDGKLGFDYADTANIPGTFLGDIAAYFGGTAAKDYQETIAIDREGYIAPFSSTIEEFAKAKVRLKFTSVTNSGSYGASYTVTVAAKDLLLDVLITDAQKSYFTLLATYYVARMEEGNLNSTAQKFIEKVLSSSGGLATESKLFDDFGATIPKGTYEVSFVQEGGGNSIESGSTSAIRVYLAAGASITLKTEDLEKTNQYVAEITPNMTATSTDGITFVEQTATKYRMVMRGYNADNEYRHKYLLDFAYDGNVWSGEFLGTDLDSIDGLGQIVYTLSPAASGAVPAFKINMSLLRNAISEILLSKGSEKFNSLLLYKVDVFAPSNGDAGVLNGKSGKFTLVYQDIDVENIKLEEGAIVLPASAPGNLNIRYAYASNQNAVIEENRSIVTGNNKVDFSCISRGSDLYFVSFSLQGAITYNTMKVESDVYGIANPYKLSQPTISTINNNLRFVYSQDDLATGVIDYMDGAIAYIVESNQETKYEATTTYRQIDYTAGLIENEKNADEFSACLLGNSGAFASLSEGDAYFTANANYDHQLVLVDNEGNIKIKDGNLYRIIFKSEKSSIAAKMLDYGQQEAASYQVKQGSLYFNIPAQDTTAIVDGQGAAAVKLYKVSVDYFSHADSGVASTPESSEDLYFTENYVVDGKLEVSGQLINRTKDLATFTVSVVMAKEVAYAAGNVVQTIDGKYFTTEDSFKYSDGSYVLRSSEFTPQSAGKAKQFGHPAVATQPTVVGTVLMYEGKINFEVGKHIAVTTEEASLAARSVVVEIKNNSGSRYIDGRISVTEIDENRNLATFTPADFADQEFISTLKGTSFTVQVMTYNGDSLLSEPLVITNVYKLPDITDRYEIKVEELVAGTGYSTYIDFQKYFDNFNIAGSRSFYQIAVTATYKQANGQTNEITTYVNAASPTFTLDSTMTQLRIQGVDAQQINAVSRIKLFNSDVTTVEIQKTEYNAKVIEGEDQEIITWDSDKLGFRWQGGEDDATYEYFYRITVENGSLSYTKLGITSEAFYGPEDMGTVTSFLIQAREIAVSDDGKPVVYIFSDSITAPAAALGKGLNKFAAGSGTMADPYIIQSVYNSSTGQVVDGMSALDQFKAIGVRNNAGVYFKLMEDIEIVLDDNYSPFAFNGNLIGNGRTISVVSKAIYDIAGGYSVASVLRGTSYTFSAYSSLFSQINASASISNLKIAYNVNYNKLSGQKVVYAPLTMFNYGKIEDITVSSLGVTYLGGENANTAFIGGLVGSNFGSISNCDNVANFNYNTTSEVTIVGYGSIACFNEKKTYEGTSYVGAIFNCENKGATNIQVVADGTIVIVGGLVVKNAANLYACANNGDIYAGTSSSNRSGVYYLGGIATTNQGGTIGYSYNNATLSYGNGTGQVAAIINILSGQVQGVAEISGVALARYCTSSGVTSIDNYIRQGAPQGASMSGVSSYSNSIQVETAEGKEIEFAGKYYSITLTITLSDGTSFTPSIHLAEVN